MALMDMCPSDRLVANQPSSTGPTWSFRPALDPDASPSNGNGEVVAIGGGNAPRTQSEPAPSRTTQAPPNYGPYIDSESQLKPLSLHRARQVQIDSEVSKCTSRKRPNV